MSFYVAGDTSFAFWRSILSGIFLRTSVALDILFLFRYAINTIHQSKTTDERKVRYFTWSRLTQRCCRWMELQERRLRDRGGASCRNKNLDALPSTRRHESGKQEPVQAHVSRQLLFPGKNKSTQLHISLNCICYSNKMEEEEEEEELVTSSY